MGGQNSLVSVVIRLLLGQPRVRTLVGERNFCLLLKIYTGSGAPKPPIQWAPEALLPGVKRQRPYAEGSPPSSAEGKNMWGGVTALPLTRLHSLHIDRLTFIYNLSSFT